MIEGDTAVLNSQVSFMVKQFDGGICVFQGRVVGKIGDRPRVRVESILDLEKGRVEEPRKGWIATPSRSIKIIK
ncbi:hypothetical protein HYW44_04520 [Candidatus Daviesbacteria bacterium]|nr:hypothetical protein [Candidatus Daviesbacteria bacterium]